MDKYLYLVKLESGLYRWFDHFISYKPYLEFPWRLQPYHGQLYEVEKFANLDHLDHRLEQIWKQKQSKEEHSA